MTDAETDLQADALLLAVVEREGGDLRAAFAVLCARVVPEDLAGETFERALARAVRTLFAKPRSALAGIVGQPAIDGEASDA